MWYEEHLSLTYEGRDICLHKTNKIKNYPSIPWENKTSAHVLEILEHPIKLSPLHPMLGTELE